MNWLKNARCGWQHSWCEALSAMCSCSAHDPCCTMRLSRSPLSPLPTVVSAGSILTWVNPSAGRRATGAQTACISVVGMAEAGAPTRTFPESSGSRPSPPWPVCADLRVKEGLGQQSPEAFDGCDTLLCAHSLSTTHPRSTSRPSTQPIC